MNKKGKNVTTYRIVVKREDREAIEFTRHAVQRDQLKWFLQELKCDPPNSKITVMRNC